MKIALNSVSDDLEQSESKLNQVRSIQILLIFWIGFRTLGLRYDLGLGIGLSLKDLMVSSLRSVRALEF